jgi:AcrR family transcriptional regulator
LARASIHPDEPGRAADIHRRNSASKRKLIIEAGKRVIFREGIWNATTRKIAEEAAINLATIHYHFSSKEALLIAVFEDMLHSVRASARADFDRPSSLAERIDRAVTLSWEYSERNLSGQMMQSELTLYALRTKGMAWLARRQLEEYLDIYSAVFRGASDIAGYRSLDLKGLSRLVVAGIDGILLQHYADPDASRSLSDCKKLIYLALRYPLSKGVEPITALGLRRRANGKGRRGGASP